MIASRSYTVQNGNVEDLYFAMKGRKIADNEFIMPLHYSGEDLRKMYHIIDTTVIIDRRSEVQDIIIIGREAAIKKTKLKLEQIMRGKVLRERVR